jgi:hypothetical protein
MSDIEPQAFRAFADDLEAMPPENVAAHRTRIGRYYFALLLEARAFLVRTSRMKSSTFETTHSVVIACLREMGDESALRAKGMLENLRTQRNKAEYGDPFPDLIAFGKSAKKWSYWGKEALAALDQRYG